MQRHLAECYGRDFPNVSEAVAFADSHGHPGPIEEFWNIVDCRNAAEHSDFLNRGFPVATKVECYHNGMWYLGIVCEVDEKANMHRVEWSLGDAFDEIAGTYWFNRQHLRHYIRAP